jgi:arginine/lysine/ornithine decarboxylase
MLLATCGPGDRVLVPRACHQAVIHGLILTGASPVYLPVRAHPAWGLPGALETEELERALDSEAAGGRAAVFLHPNYYGLTGALEIQIQKVQARGFLALVDEAHGTHFCAGTSYPVPALRAGADLVAQGAHKVLGAFTQAAFLHHRGTLPDPGKLQQALRIVQSSSPSYLLLASLDVARHQFCREKEKWEEVASLGMELRYRVSQIPGLFAPGEELKEVPGVVSFDPARLIVNVRGLGITGFGAAAWLRRERRIQVELADFQNILFILSPADSGLVPDLLAGLGALARAVDFGREWQASTYPEPPDLPLPRQLMTPREAFFAPQREAPLAAARGKVAAEVVAPYPPGVPLICPGEEINPEALAYLAAWQEAGGVWPGRKKGTVKIVAGS